MAPTHRLADAHIGDKQMLKTTINQLLQKVRNMQTLTHPQRNQAARYLENMGKHKDYTKFVILGRSRSGSNFLRGLLNSHRRITAFGELFQNDEMISWGLSGYPESPQLLALFRSDPVCFLETEIFRTVPKTIQSVGFKIFYYHAHSAKWQPVWDYLAAQPELKVIHIKRNNLLKIHLSRKRATATDRWVNVSGEREPHTPVRLDYEECLADFVQTRAWENEYARFFANHAMLDMSYELLACDYQAEMKRVQNFLGVEPQGLAPETHRQSDASLSASITNYDELKKQFEGSVWHAFFED
jgi:LPS sulfotransferase NodH